MNKALINRTLLTIFLTATVSFTCRAGEGGASPGGGDRCEARFKAVAGDLKAWILAGGPSSLNLNLSARRVDVIEYSRAMIEQIDRAVVTCVSPGESGYPVLVNNRPKECLNFVDREGVNRVVCDRAKFYSNSASPDNDPAQYALVHHELATLAGFEIPSADNSQYPLSNQITGFLADQLVKKLAIKPAAAISGIEPSCFPQLGSICVPHPGLFLQQSFILRRDIVLAKSPALTFFVDGAQVSVNKAMRASSFCTIAVSTNSVGALNLPAALQKDGVRTIPAVAGPFVVTNMSWYVRTVFLDGTMPTGERVGIVIRCGTPDKGAASDDLTSFAAFATHLRGVLDEE